MCLIFLVKILSKIFKGKFLKIIQKVINYKTSGFKGYIMGYFSIFVGTVLTLLIQSSSVFTSLLTPVKYFKKIKNYFKFKFNIFFKMVGLGVVKLESVFPLILGSNIGTTITGILAALSVSSKTLQYSLQIALAHTIFNISGIQFI